MRSELLELPIPSGDSVLDALPAVGDLLAGTGPARLPVPAGDERERSRLASALRPGEPIDDGVALVVATSGTTGVPKGAMLSAAALRASGNATHDRLGGPGTWLLALPPHHIAGLQVLLRSVLAGTTPAVLDVRNGFDTKAFAAAVEAMAGPRRYTSLVPTQLIKALDDPAAVEALRAFEAVLIGGAATPVPVRERAIAAGVRIVRTYGMSETCGGCVYDGVPLDGVIVEIDDGRIILGGPMVASGYRGRPGHPAFAQPGRFRTDDAGVLQSGVLSVLGRLDEAISTGGLTIVPQVVEAALNSHPAVRESAVFGVPDDRLGERVVAAIVSDDPPSLASLREHVAAQLDPTAAPRELLLLDTIPVGSTGKVDRATLRARLQP